MYTNPFWGSCCSCVSQIQHPEINFDFRTLASRHNPRLEPEAEALAAALDDAINDELPQQEAIDDGLPQYEEYMVDALPVQDADELPQQDTSEELRGQDATGNAHELPQQDDELTVQDATSGEHLLGTQLDHDTELDSDFLGAAPHL